MTPTRPMARVTELAALSTIAVARLCMGSTWIGPHRRTGDLPEARDEEGDQDNGEEYSVHGFGPVAREVGVERRIAAPPSGASLPV